MLSLYLHFKELQYRYAYKGYAYKKTVSLSIVSDKVNSLTSCKQGGHKSDLGLSQRLAASQLPLSTL